MFDPDKTSSDQAHPSRPEDSLPDTSIEGGEVRAGDVAIIGMAGRFPGARDIERFWENLCGGVESIARFAPEELEPSPLVPRAAQGRPELVPAGGILGDGDCFDHAFFSVTPAEARQMNPQLRVFLETAWSALESAGYDPRAYPGKISLYAGAGLATPPAASEPDGENPAARFAAITASKGELMPLRVAHELGLRGESLSIYTACSTSLVAVHMACQSLLLRQSDMALAGGVSVSLPERTGYLYQEGMIFSPDGHCRAFDERARGTVGGNGSAAVVLKLLEDALRDGDHVVAVIRGSAINNDGGVKVGFTAPSVAGQVDVIRQALSLAEVAPETIGYVEAHGTGTPLGDPIEIEALTQAYREHTAETGYCAIGAVKTNVGHLDTAAGVVGLIKTALVLSRGEIPPTLHFERPNPNIDFAASPFYVNTERSPFPSNGEPRRAAVSSFGIGGTNAHAVLEEPPARPSRTSARVAHLFQLSARTPEALSAMATALADHVERHPEQPLADVAYTLALGRRAFEHRHTVVASDHEELSRKLRAELPSTSRVPKEAPQKTTKVAFLLSGQGSQAVGMGGALYRTEPLFRQTIDEADRVLRPLLGLSLTTVISPHPDRLQEAEAALARPDVAQPALVAVEFALAKLWASWGLRAGAYLGHSLGEYTAACLAGVLSFEDVLRVVHERGRLTARTAEGRMLSVALPAERLAEVLAEVSSESLSLAAINARDRSVVAGPPAEIDALAETLSARKVPVSRLPVRHAFHSCLVEPVLGELQGALGRTTLRSPEAPYVSSRTGTWIRAEEATQPASWAAQMREPVRFAAGLDTLIAAGFTTLIEVGPDQVLTLLARAHLGAQARVLPSLPRAASRSDAHAVLLGSLGELWAAGAAPAFEAVYAEEKRRRVPLPTYSFARTRFPVVVATSSQAAAPSPHGSSAEAPVAAPKAEGGLAATDTATDAAPSPDERGTVERIAALWRDLLGVPHVDTQSSFLDLGGNSLMAAQALTRLRDLFLVDIPLADLFEAPTVGELAARIDQRIAEAGITLAAPRATAREKPKPLVRRIERLAPGAPRPLSFVEERVLQVEALEPGTVSLNMHLFLRSGALDRPRLEEALGVLVARHEGLRTLYRHDHQGQQGQQGPQGQQGVAGTWTAVVQDRLAVPIAFVDLFNGEETLEARRARAASFAAEEAERPLDIQRGSVLRATLVRIAPDEHHLLFTIHHVMADTGSLFILGSELSEIYQALAEGRAPELPALPVQYGDFAAWQRRSTLEGAYAEHTAYWREQLADLPALSLVANRAPAGREHLRRSRYDVAWPAAITDAANELARRHGTTPFAVVLAAYALLLGRYSLQDEVVIGTPLGNRNRPELARMLGYVAQSVAFRVRLGGEPTFAELLRRVHTVVIEAHEHGDAPFEMLACEFGRTRDPQKARLLDAVIVFHAITADMERLSQLDFQPFLVNPSTDFSATLGHMALNVNASSDGIAGNFCYNPDVFEGAEAARFVGRLAALIEAAAAAPETPISALPLTDTRTDTRTAAETAERDRAALTGDAQRGRSSERGEPWTRVLHRLPDSAALLEGDTTIRADELERRAERVARGLLQAGCARGTVVGLRLASVADTLAALMGTLRAGAVAMLLDDAALNGTGTGAGNGTGTGTVTGAGPAHVLEAIPPPGAPGALPSLPALDEPAMVVRPCGRTQAFVFGHRSLAAYMSRLDERLGSEAGTFLAAGDRRRDRSWLELLWALGRGFSIVVPREDAGALLTLRSGLREPGREAREVREVRRALDFSLFYFAADEDTTGTEKYRLLLEGARRADELGFRAIWTPERHFHPFGGMYPNPSVLSAALAASTRRIGLRAGSVVLPLHHPLRVAEEWSVVDNLSGGRVGVAFASGWHARDFVFAPGQRERRRQVLRRSLEQVRALWRGEEQRFSNGEGEVALRIYPRPVQRELPVWLTSTGALETFVLAGELGAHLLTNLMGQKLDDLVAKIGAYRRAWEEHGHGPGRGHVTLMMHAFVSSDLDVVRRTVREPLLAYLRSSMDVVKGFATTTGIDPNTFSQRDLTVLVEHSFDRYLYDSGLFGTPASCRERMEHLRRMDVDEVACLIDFGIPTETVIENFDHLAELMRAVNEGVVSSAVAESLTWQAASETAMGLLARTGATHLQASPALVRALAASQNGTAAPASCVLVHDGTAADGAWSGRSASSALAMEPGAWETPIEPLGTSESFGAMAASGSRLAVLDRHGQPLPCDVPGELAVVGDEVPLGYHGDHGYHGAEDTRADFLSPLDPSLPARRYRTGRIARRRQDGRIELLGSLPAGFRAAPRALQKAPGRRFRTPPPIRRTEDRRRAPLSFSQQRLWLIDQIEPGLIAYNNAFAIRLSGSLDVPPLLRALDEIIARHEVWRTAFLTTEGGDPVQEVLAPFPLDVPLVEVEGDGEDAQFAEIARRMTALGREPFDLRAPPLLRAVLFRLSANTHVLGMVMHHIVSDGWTGSVFGAELTALYRAFRHGESSPLGPLPVQYTDYSVWQREWLTDEVIAAELDYWKTSLAGIPTVLDLPTDHPRPPVMTYRGARSPVFIPRALTERMNAFARQKGATPFMALMAAFSALIYRWSGQARFLYGTPVAGRSRPEIEGLIGVFVNTLVLRADVTGDPSFRELLDRSRRTALDAFGHMELPFEQLVDAVVAERDLGRAPLLQALMVLHNMPATTPRLDDVDLGNIFVDTGTSKLDLLLEFIDTPDGLQGSFEYATDLFTAQTIARLAQWLVRLLDAMLADPDAPISRLSLADPAERARLAAWNDVAVPYASERCVHELFEAQAQRTSDAVAVESEGARLSYAELDAQANRLAHHLRSLGVGGVGPETHVGLCVERSLDMVVGLLGILKAGGAYVPLDPTYPAERLSFMVEDAAVTVLVTQASLADRFSQARATLVCLDVDLDGAEAAWRRAPDTRLEAGGSAENVAYVIYTSGSTGRPKGVSVTHRSIARLVTNTNYITLGPEDRVTQTANIAFDASTFEIWAPLVAGARLVILPREVTLAPTAFRQALTSHGITTLFVTTALLHRLADESPQILATVRDVLFGGEAADAAKVRRVLDQGPPGRLLHMYGPTECTTFATWHHVARLPDGASTVPIGGPVSNTTAHVLDPRLHETPIGLVGELYLGGPGVARGYLNQPALTAERFVPDPFSAEPGARMYRTGDLVRWTEDGALEFLGRADQQVKIRGFRIELGEIESALGAHPAVKACVVMAREDSPGDKRLVAYVVSGAAEASPAALREHLRTQLPDYMVPSAYVFLPSLPLTPNGKIDRKALPAPEGARATGAASYVAPRTPMEEALAALWEELLGVRPIGVHDDFFVLGGHSLLAVRLMSRMTARLGSAPAMATLFQHPTIAALSAIIDGTSELLLHGHDGASVHLRPLLRGAGEAPYAGLSGTERRLWFLERLYPEARSYQVPQVLRVGGELDEAALRASLATLARRHEILRTTYPEVNGAPVRCVADAASTAWRAEDVSSLPAAEQDAALRALVAQEVATRFDLEHGPLTRVLLIRASAAEHVVVLHQHHIITDEWSTAVLLSEWSTLYGAQRSGREVELPALPFQLAEHARAEEEALSGEGFAASRRYWKDKLAGLPRLELSIVRSTTDRPATDQGQGEAPGVQGHVLVHFSAEESAAWRALGRAAGATPFMAWAAVVTAVLGRYSGQKDFGVGAAVANRETQGTEGLLGFFTNTVVLRADLGGDPTFREWLGRARETAIEAIRHQALPFDVVVQDQGVAVARRAGETPLYDVSFFEVTAPEVGETLFRPDWSLLPEGVTTAKTGLSVAVTHGQDGTSVAITYDTARVARASIERLCGHLRAFVRDALAHPDRRLSELSLLTEAEVAQLAAWNHTAAPVPAEKLIHELFEEQARRTPDAVAVEYEDARLSYAELDAKADRLAHHLRSFLGVGPETRVGICVERSLDMIVGLLGILKAGGAYVPLDPAYPTERLSAMLEDARVAVLVTQSHLAVRLPAHGMTVVRLDQDGSWGTRPGDALPKRSTGAEHLIYILFTSGSTGRPKGVAVPHRAVARLVQSPSYASFGPDDAFLQYAPLAFDASTLEIWAPLTNGARLVVCPAGQLSLDELAEVIRRRSVTTLWLTAGLFQALVDARPDALTGVRQLLTGGDVVSPPHARSALARMSGVVVNGYGPTENTTFTTCHRIERKDTERGGLPIGRPISGTYVRVLDQALREVPIGVAGELYTGGLGLARGYDSDVGLTAERFVPDPFSSEPGARMYRTGDLVRWNEDGALEFLGRADQQVKIRGFRIELGEIESALGAHPAVQGCVVTAREDSPGDKRLVAYVVSGEAEISPAELREHLRAQLPDYMVPSAYVSLPSLPITSNGKVDRKALPAPEGTRDAAVASYVAPRTLTEEALAVLWEELLDVRRIGIHDDFFTLGGHSLLAVRLMSRITAKLGQALAMASLFQHPTIAALGAIIDGAGEQSLHGGAAHHLHTRPRAAGEAPYAGLSGTERRLWFLERLYPEARSYQVPLVLRVVGQLDEAALRMSLDALARRHEILRTTYPEVDGAPVRAVAAEASTAWRTEDVSSLSAPERDAALRTLVAKEVAAPFDLERGPLTRVLHLRVSPAEHVVVFHQHHIITDEWSTAVLLSEWSALYEALRSGRRVELPALPFQLADYARAEDEAFAGDGFAASRHYWRQQLAGLPRLKLPIVRPATGQGQGQVEAPGTEGHVLAHFSAEESAAWRALGRAEGATPFMAWMAVFTAALGRYSGQKDFGVGVVIANRETPGTEGLLGFFTNTVVLRADLGGDPTFREWLSRTRRTAIDAIRHQAVPFDVVVQDQGIGLARRAGETPLYDVSFFEVTAPEVGETLFRPDWSLFPEAVTTAKDSLAVAVTHGPDGTSVAITYDTSRVSRAAAERLGGHLRALVRDALTHPDRHLSELSLLTEAEVAQIDAWTHAAPPTTPAPVVFSSERCVHQLFEAQAEKTPDATAVESEDRRLSYAELDAEANRLAHHLRSLGVGPEARVGLCVERSPEMVVGLLAILKAGGAYVPLDPTHPAERLSFMLSDARISVLLTEERHAESLPSHGGHGDRQVRRVRMDAPQSQSQSPWATLPATRPESRVTPDHAMYVVYTSGSTGQPKGVVVEGRGVVSLLSGALVQQRYAPPCKVLQRSSISFDTLVVELLGPLVTGGCAVLLPPGQEADPGAIARAIRRHGVTYADVPPSLLVYLLQEPDFCEAPSLRLVNAGGEALSPTLIGAFRRQCRAALWNAYGPTETTVEATLWPVEESAGAEKVRIGRPLPRVRAYVLDPAGRLLPCGIPGELCIAGTGLARGYLDRPALTAERFVPDPFSKEPGARMYRTGDLVRWDEDGQLEFLGRIDHQVKLRGYRVELGEIEAVLSSYPDVRGCAVLLQEDTPSDRRLVAYVASGAELSPAALREHLSGQLPAYMVPSSFVFLEALPLTPAGKIDRQALAALGGTEEREHRPFEAPRTEAERALAAIWREVLGTDRVGIHDDFFALGGNSILTLKVVSLAVRAGLSLSARDLFAHPTLATLAALSTDLARPTIALDLAREAVLAEDLRFEPRPGAPGGDGLFLTGATGFVGAHVLRLLLQRTSREVHCLVRGKTEEDARAHLLRALDGEAHAGLSEMALARVRVVPGDLAQPLFGLTAEAFGALAARIGVVIHGGAEVNHLAPYDTMRAANVKGTETVLRLCAAARAALHHLSTTDVFKEVEPGGAEALVDELDRPQLPPAAESGYAASKWVAERLVLAAKDRGLQATVYRLGLLGGDSRTGALPLRHYWLTQGLRMRLALGMVPDRSLSFLPCDFAADFIAANALDERWEGGSFHLDADRLDPEELASLVRGVAGRGRVVPLEEWMSEVRRWVRSTGRYDEGHELLLSLFGQGGQGGQDGQGTTPRAHQKPALSTARARRRAAELKVAWPERHAPDIEATLRFIHRHHEAELLGTAAPRRQATSVRELRTLLADLEAHVATLPPAPLTVRPTDVFIATFPKCGTTWAQQIVHGLRTRGSMDFPEISYVIPFVENAPLNGVDLETPQGAEPRAFKTHLPWSLVPRGGKYIYVMRDPRDALLSAYHFYDRWYFERGALDVREWSEEMFFKSEREPHGYWQHVRSFWEQRENPDVLLLCFEDMLADPEHAVRRIAAFAGIPLDDELIAIATRQSSIEFMRAHKDQFDERQTVEALSRLFGFPRDAGTTKVRSGRAGEGQRTLPADVLARLEEAWRREIEAPLGIRSYDELRTLCRKLP